MGPPNLFIDTLPLRTSVIAFIGILGFRQLVTNAYSESTEAEALDAKVALGEALESIAGLAEEQNQLESGSNFRLTRFSNSVVISDSLQGQGIARVFDTASRFAAALLWRGFACRGGITSGLLVHQEGLLLGPAMIAAYDLGRGAAIYPRIVIADSLSLDSEERPGHWRVVRDQDGFRFLDVFYRIRHVDRDGTTPGSRLDRVRRLIEAQLRVTTAAPNVIAKWRWLEARCKIDR